MSEAPLMLGVSGLRGIVGKSLTPEVAARYAEAFGGWIRDRACPSTGNRRPKHPLIVLANDGRVGSGMIVASATAGLLAAGCDVENLHVAMTPTVGVAADLLGAAGGMQVTASHNPQEWNGLKLLVREKDARKGRVSACAPDKNTAEEIIRRFNHRVGCGIAWDGIGHHVLSAEEVQGHYEVCQSAVESACSAKSIQRRRFRVALDSVGGSGGLWSKTFLDWELGCRVISSGDYSDGVFTHAAEPTRANLAGFCRTVRAKRVHIGFAQDPDADRLAIVDERGEYIGEEYTLALAAESLLSGLKPAKGKARVLVTNLSTSRMLDDIAAAHGARVVRTPVGEANVVEAMKREKAAGYEVVLGGEGNGGVIWPKVTYVRDSLSAMALVLSLMARTGKKVSELVAAIPAYAIEKRKVDLARKEDAKPAVEKIAAAYRDQKTDLQDGVRVDWLARKAWLHVRASNTEPIMRLIAEAPTAAESRAILEDAARVIAG